MGLLGNGTGLVLATQETCSEARFPEDTTDMERSLSGRPQYFKQVSSRHHKSNLGLFVLASLK